ncbi:Conserved hypothetical membrane protein [Candidatus Protochlamydia naegleriophila]|uniref:Conserved hypothetical membrane protein n=1 Tax=Candidatus Protochlamydia naegleriophila TaxID=389348 RepID=A0A0U5JFS6_9BACT|nr:hypothetical protein [Candidatus Protochlamydia naegleriophila]CUI17668.1 Conserved hypothetical membrane protein [Candidatus Protochlamydia naegleriophila]
MIGQIIDYINPFSNSYHACQAFKELNGKQKIITIALTAIATIVSAGIGTAAAFRALVGRFKEIQKDHSPETQAVHEVTQKILSPEVSHSSDPEVEPSSVTSSSHTSEKKESNSENPILKPLDNPAEALDNPIEIDDDDLTEESYVYSDGDEYDNTLDDEELDDLDDYDYSYDEESLIVDEADLKDIDGEDDIARDPQVKISTQAQKLMSKRTILCREKLGLFLAEKNREIFEVPDESGEILDTDTGDCFYAAFAAGIGHQLGKVVTVQDIRRIVSEELKKLHAENSDNWVRKTLESSFGELDTYESYLNFIHEDAETALKNNRRLFGGKKELMAYCYVNIIRSTYVSPK